MTDLRDPHKAERLAFTEPEAFHTRRKRLVAKRSLSASAARRAGHTACGAGVPL